MITPDQFNEARPALEALRRKTRPRKHDLYDVFNAIVHLLGNETPWRLLPREGFPPWRTVHEYFTIWTAETVDGRSVLRDILVDLKRYDEVVALDKRLAGNAQYRRHVTYWRDR